MSAVQGDEKLLLGPTRLMPAALCFTLSKGASVSHQIPCCLHYVLREIVPQPGSRSLRQATLLNRKDRSLEAEYCQSWSRALMRVLLLDMVGHFPDTLEHLAGKPLGHR